MWALDLYQVKAGNVEMKQFMKGYPSVSCLRQIAVENFEKIESKIGEIIGTVVG